MTTNNSYLAVFLGSKTSAKMAAWNALPEEDRLAKGREGMAAWKAWIGKHQDAVAGMGGPLGKTKKITERGIEDVGNDMGAYMVVHAELPKQPPSSLKTIRTSQSFQASLSRSCRSCPYRAPKCRRASRKPVQPQCAVFAASPIAKLLAVRNFGGSLRFCHSADFMAVRRYAR